MKPTKSRPASETSQVLTRSPKHGKRGPDKAPRAPRPGVGGRPALPEGTEARKPYTVSLLPSQHKALTDRFGGLTAAALHLVNLSDPKAFFAHLERFHGGVLSEDGQSMWVPAVWPPREAADPSHEQ